ncbi:MAG: AMP-binding protein [Puniceicoccaceae bacterium]
MEQLAGRLRESLSLLPEVEVVETDPLVIAQANPLNFWSLFTSALESGKSVAVLSPEWPADWLAQLGDHASAYDPEVSPSILIPTSGSSGIPKFCIHTMDTIISAAAAFNSIAEDKSIRHNINVLPQYHVGGMMPVFRSVIAGGKTHFADYRHSESIDKAPFPAEEACISLVPTQLRRMLEEPALCSVLQSMGMVLVGGAACGDRLLAEAREKQIRLAPCYGSTETAALVTLLDPQAFLEGVSGVGNPLPRVRISLGEENKVEVTSASNCLGYWPAGIEYKRDPFETNDIGMLEPSGNLHILGRADRVIITGGEKVIPEIVEAAAQASGLVEEVNCFGTPDPDWGMRVELEFTTKRKATGVEARLEAWLKDWVPPYAVPKSITRIEGRLTNEMGKHTQK